MNGTSPVAGPSPAAGTSPVVGTPPVAETPPVVGTPPVAQTATCKCPADSFYNGTLCVACPSPICSSCSNSTFCTACGTGAILSAGTCSCRDQYY